MSVYGIGPEKAETLYREGWRSLKDLGERKYLPREARADADGADSSKKIGRMESESARERERRVRDVLKRGFPIEDALVLVDELNTKCVFRDIISSTGSLLW